MMKKREQSLEVFFVRTRFTICNKHLTVYFGGLVLVVGSPTPARDSYLVDPASSHMLVSKIKPCMSKYKQIHTVKLRMAH